MTHSEQGKLYYQNNKEKVKERIVRYNKINKDAQSIRKRNYKNAHAAEIKIKNAIYYKKNRERLLKQRQGYLLSNLPRIREEARIRQNKRRKLLPIKIEMILRSRLWCALKRQRAKKSTKTIKLLGCSVGYLIQHLESKFQTNMSWNNYGAGQGKWNIDHIIPCSKFDLTKPVEQNKCFHFSNLQPLWWEQNRDKSDKLNWTIDQTSLPPQI